MLNEIKQLVLEEISTFDAKFRQALTSQAPLLDKVMRYIVKRKGKQVRPLFVFLSAKLLGETNERTYRAATLVELLHTATLVHDDIVDESNLRRSFFSINALWKNKVAVLAGDYLLSKGLLLAIENKDFDLLEIVSRAVRDMSEGELLQIEKARRLDIVEKVYFDIIGKKTAALLAASTACGAASTSDDAAAITLLHDFGFAVGIAFQIKDDLLDFEKASIIGKPAGIDIKEKKMTLPLIHALQQCDVAQRRHIINLVRRHNTNPKKVEEVLNFVRVSQGIAYAQEKMKMYKNNALIILNQFPASEARHALTNLVEFVISRQR